MTDLTDTTHLKLVMKKQLNEIIVLVQRDTAN